MPDNKIINIGIIGYGWIVKVAHIPAIQSNVNVRLVAIYDSDYSQFDSFDKNIILTDDINMFFEIDMDAVIIATPNALHTYYTEEALKRDLHVLCEKPIGFSRDEVEQLLQIAERKNLLYVPAYVNRYREDVILTRKMIREGIVGNIKKIQAKWLRKEGIPRSGCWNTNCKIAGGGVLQDLGSHIIDICHFFSELRETEISHIEMGAKNLNIVNNASWISSKGARFPFDVETWAKAEIYINKQVPVIIELDWAADIDGDYTEFVITGTKGEIVLHTLFGFSTNFSQKDSKYISINNFDSMEIIDVRNVKQMNAFVSQIDYFCKSILMNQKNNRDWILYSVDVIEKLYAREKAT